MRAVASAKLLIGGAGAAALTVRVTRSLYARWHALPAGERARIAPLAERAKRSALDMRGAVDRERAGAEAREAGATLAAALVASAESDPELDPEEVGELREDLRRELARLAKADIKASRSTHGQAKPPG
jgi:hypothetical protein